MTGTALRRTVARIVDKAKTAAERHPTLAAGAGYLLLVVALFRELVFEGRVLFERDIHLFWYTQVESFVRIVTTPAWPLWDPYTSFGQPLLADPSAQIFYPPTWLNLLMRPWVYCTLFVLCHLVFSGVGAFRLMRRLGVSHLGSFTAGALWITSGPLLSLVNNLPHFTGATWLPWVLLAAQRAADRVSWTTSVTWGVVLAGQIIAGSADMCALGLLGSAILLTRNASPRFMREICRRIGAALVAVCVAAGLTAALLLPLLDVVSRSARRALPEALRTLWSLHPIRLFELVFPLPWQYLAVNPGLWTNAFEDRDPFLHSIYVGLPTVALLLSAIATRRRGLLRALVAIAGVGLMLALGRHLPLYGWLVMLIPPLKILRYPQKLLLLVSLGVAAIAGLGVEAWQTRDVGGQRWLRRVLLPLALFALAVWAAFWTLAAQTCAVGTFLACLPLAPSDSRVALVAHRLIPACVLLSVAVGLALLRSWRRSAFLTAVLLACVAVAELYRAHRDLNPTTTPDLFRHRPVALTRLPRQDGSRLYVHDYLRVKGDAQRYLGLARPYASTRAPLGWSPLESNTLAMRDALVPPVAAAWGYESAYEIDFRGLYGTPLTLLTNMLREAEDVPAAHLRLLQIGAVRDVVTLHTKGYEHLLPAGIVESLFLAEPIRILRVPQPLPRVYAVSGVRVLDGERAILLLAARAFDPRRELVLDAGLPRAPDPQFIASCKIIDFRPDRVRVEAVLSQPGYVVLVDTFDPGWKATVDGRATPVLRANVAFRAVPVAAGRHEVMLLYRPASVFWGLGISLATLLSLACGAAFWHHWRKSTAVDAHSADPSPRMFASS